MKRITVSVLILVALACGVSGDDGGAGDIFDVADYGAVGDGVSDDTQAFADAWEKACKGNSQNPTFQISSDKSFFLRPITFKGPCNANINVTINANLVAPNDLSKFDYDDDGESKQWISFDHVDGLTITGKGTIDGQGSIWWDRPCRKKKHCPKAPTALVIQHSNNLVVNNLKFVNSPQMHLAFEHSTNIVATELFISSPEDSPNTDGIHIQASQFVQIKDSVIGTGDDCISIGRDSSRVNITGITCGPGHGISIGSLGENGEDDNVEYVHVTRSTFNGTTNGARIKTKPGGSGYARNIFFMQLQMNDVKNPIIIDQNYVDNHKKHDHLKHQNLAVKVSDITYSSISGTSKEELAVSFNCSDVNPCNNIRLSDINLGSTSDGDKTWSVCSNLQGFYSGEVSPQVDCLNAL